MNHHTRIRTWRNSPGIRIRKHKADRLHPMENTKCIIDAGEKRSVVPPVPNEKTLQSMMEAVTQEMLHEEIDWGRPVGKEIW